MGPVGPYFGTPAAHAPGPAAGVPPAPNSGASAAPGAAAGGGIRLFLDETTVRAWPGGAGQFKLGGNYAPTVRPQWEAAQRHGASQVVYALPPPGGAGAGAGARDDATLAEAGAMNLFFLIEPPGGGGLPELVTPPLDGARAALRTRVARALHSARVLLARCRRPPCSPCPSPPL